MDGSVLPLKSQDDGPRAPRPPTFCTGVGQADTHSHDIMGRDGLRRPNPHPSAGRAYQSIAWEAIVALVGEPDRVDKEQGRWIIPSTYTEADARSHSTQREHGQFWLLPLDVDGGNLSLAEIERAIVQVCGDVDRAIYSTRSAQAHNRKWRAFVALSAPISGTEYSETVRALNELLAEASAGKLVADRALCRPGQLVYLPNRGDFYEYHVAQDKPPLALGSGHPITQRRERNRAKQAEIERLAAEENAARKARRSTDATASIVETFNQRHELADLFLKYGYEPECEMGGRDWRSPYQTSGSHATRDCGDYWVSLSGSDADRKLGKETASGVRSGDAFDLFVHFDNGGDFNAAVRAYAAQIGEDYAAKHRDRDPADYFEAVEQDTAGETQAAERRPPRLLPVISFEDAAKTALAQSARPLVKGLLDQGAFSVFYGPSNSGKTFVVLDLAYSISLGRDWAGMKTTQAPVLYIAAEGGGGIKKRILALGQRPGAVSPKAFHLVASSIDLRRPDGDVTAIIDTARDKGQVGLIVIDTLSRALAGGDETKDMGALVVNIDKIRRETGAHVLLVHHSGKDEAKGARGSSELRGAIDTEINIADGRIRVTKQRDLEFAGDVHFEIQGTIIGVDEDQDPVTSATVRLNVEQRDKPRAPTAKEAEVLGLVREIVAQGQDGVSITAEAVARGYKAQGVKMTADTARKHLQSLAEKQMLFGAGRGRWVLAPVRTPEHGEKSGNSTLPKTTGAFPAYDFPQAFSEHQTENGVFQ